MPRTIAVIDADSFLYAEAAKAETCIDGDTWLQTQPIERVAGETFARLDKVVKFLEADDAVICLTSSRNFRKEILPTYKAQRKALHKPILLPALRRIVCEEEPYKTFMVDGLEADDLCGIAAGQLSQKGRNAIIVSSDKDLRSVPGMLWNPNPAKGTNKGRPVEHITEAEADRFHMYQTLVGDIVDNYQGCPGIGPVKAITILNECELLTPAERWQKVVDTFVSKRYTVDDALVQARVARICRVSDWDAQKKEPILWNPPTAE